MSVIYKSIIDVFNKKINLLVIDDEPIVLDVVVNMFPSPLFNINTGSSLEQAYQKIDEAEEPWHCWILDINIGDGENGLDILKRHPKFPFTIMLSGLGSMTTATQALQNGAMKVFDKTPDSLDLLHEEVCKVSALGFILGGTETQYLSNFTLLKENRFLSPVEWANRAFVTVRQLERICASHSPLSPRYFISFFYTIYYILSKVEEISLEPLETSESESNTDINNFYQTHVNFVSKNIEKYQQLLCG
jgi:CheY-like chemotaxis protein